MGYIIYLYIQLKKNRQLLDVILSNAGEGICGLDIQGRIIFANKSAEVILEYEAGGLIGNHFLNNISMPSLTNEQEAISHSKIQEAIKNGTSQLIDAEKFVTKNGTSIPVEYSASPILNNNRSVSGVVVVFKNITERLKNTEAIQLKNQELLRSNDEKDELLDMLAHDLKNPINIISGYGNLIHDEIIDKPELQELQNYSSELLGATKGITQQIQDVLNYSKITSEELEIQLNEEDISIVTNHIVDRNRHWAKQKEITIHTEITDSLVIQTNMTRYIEVLDNLVSNALKYTQPRGNVFVSLIKKDNGIELRVRDDGPGFTESDMNLLFKRFQKLSSRPTGGENSSGLGLSIVKRLVQRLGATIDLVSKPGEGAEFLVIFPIDQ